MALATDQKNASAFVKSGVVQFYLKSMVAGYRKCRSVGWLSMGEVQNHLQKRRVTLSAAALKKQELALVAKMESGGEKEGSNNVGMRHHKDSPEDLQWVR
jgi:hypothetical protein